MDSGNAYAKEEKYMWTWQEASNRNKSELLEALAKTFQTSLMVTKLWVEIALGAGSERCYELEDQKQIFDALVNIKTIKELRVDVYMAKPKEQPLGLSIIQHFRSKLLPFAELGDTHIGKEWAIFPIENDHDPVEGRLCYNHDDANGKYMLEGDRLRVMQNCSDQIH